MTWEIYIDPEHPALSADRLTLMQTTEDLVKQEKTTVRMTLTTPRLLRINTEDLTSVVAALQTFKPAHPILSIKRSDVPVETSLPYTTDTISIKEGG